MCSRRRREGLSPDNSPHDQQLYHRHVLAECLLMYIDRRIEWSKRRRSRTRLDPRASPDGAAIYRAPASDVSDPRRSRGSVHRDSRPAPARRRGLNPIEIPPRRERTRFASGESNGNRLAPSAPCPKRRRLPVDNYVRDAMGQERVLLCKCTRESNGKSTKLALTLWWSPQRMTHPSIVPRSSSTIPPPLPNPLPDQGRTNPVDLTSTAPRRFRYRRDPVLPP
jgi:hypothetical protein